MSYIEVDVLRSYLRANTQTPLPGGDDDLLLTAIVDAESFIHDHTGRRFAAEEDTTRYFDAIADVCGRTLTLDHDLADIPTEVVNGDGQIIPSTAFVLEPTNDRPAYAIKLKAGHGYIWQYVQDPEAAIAVTGKWAYSAAPSDGIKRICKRLAVYFYRQRSSPADMDRPIMTTDGVILTPSRIPTDAADQLRIYRKRSL